MEDLICIIVEELYGSDPAKLAQVLYLKNKCPFKSLLEFSKLNEQAVRNALIVLIQQLLVSYEEKPKIIYFLNVSEVVSRIRYPRYIRLLNIKYGENCCVEDILENGCCSLSQLTDNANEGCRNPETVSNIIRDMISNDYLVPVDQKTEYSDSIDTAVHKKSTGRPRKKLKLTTPNEPLLSMALPRVKTDDTNNEVFYRLNFNKLNRELMVEMIGNLISSKTTVNCAIIGETMYKLGYRSLNKAEISGALPSLPKMTGQMIESSLEMMEKLDIVMRDTENTWKINAPLLTSNLCTSALEKIIHGRFGDYSSRVFRILCNKGLLDDKTISDLTLLPLKETNICLNELYVAGFIYTKPIGTSQMYYGVKADAVKIDICTQCYRSVHNLKVKLASEMEEVWGLVQRVGFLSNEEKQVLERYKHIESRIESAVLELDRTIMVFNSEI